MSLREHLIAAGLALAVMALSLLVGQPPERAEEPPAPAEVADAQP